MLDQFRRELHQLVAAGKLIDAFDKLRAGIAEHSEYFNPALTRLCHYRLVHKKHMGGLLSEKEFLAEQNQTASALLALLDGLSEQDLNPAHNDHFQATLETIALGKMGKLHLVNCDRQEPFRAFTAFYQHGGRQPYQFYFIAGEPAQKPSSFAERIIYEIIEDQQTHEDDIVIEYEREAVWAGDTRTERVKFTPLPLGLNAASSQIKFKKYFSERMAQYRLSVTPDAVSEAPHDHLQFNFVALVFQLEAESWDQEVTRYLRWMIEYFRNNQSGQPKVLLFFVVHHSDNQRITSSDALSDIQEIVNGSPDCCLLIKDLLPVSRDAVRDWFKSVSTVPDESKIETLIDQYSQQISQKEQQDKRSDFNMMDLEPLLERVYLQWLKKK